MVRLDKAFEDCLTRLSQGETLEDCLRRYPRQAVELRRLLATSQEVQKVGAIHPSETFKARARHELVNHMNRQPRPALRTQAASIARRQVRLAFALAIVTLVFLTAGTVYAQGALPGDAFYGWKLSSERAWRLVASDKLGLDLALLDRRATELVRVASEEMRVEIGVSAYLEVLVHLSGYGDPGDRELILVHLAEQQVIFEAAGLEILPHSPEPETGDQEGAPDIAETPLPLEEFLDSLLTPTATPTSTEEGLLDDLLSPVPTLIPSALPTGLPGSGILP